jgi:branched-chain amino acid transport system permease protein
MDAFLTILASGLGLGCVYGLVAVSYNVVYRGSGVFSFAQGQLLMLGSMGAYELTMVHKLPLIVGFLITCAGVAGVNVAVERIAVRPVVASAAPLWVLSTLGAGLLITAIAERIWGTEPLLVGSYLTRQNVTIGGATISTAYLFPAVAVVILPLALWQFEKRTRLGKAIRALALNREAAVLAGIPISRYSMLTFALGGAVAGAAGFLTAPILYADPTSGFAVGVLAFAGWAIGGFGSNTGAVVGGLIVGITTQLSSFYWNTQIPPVTVLAMLLLVMLVRPQGLFGKIAARQV